MAIEVDWLPVGFADNVLLYRETLLVRVQGVIDPGDVLLVLGGCLGHPAVAGLPFPGTAIGISRGRGSGLVESGSCVAGPFVAHVGIRVRQAVGIVVRVRSRG